MRILAGPDREFVARRLVLLRLGFAVFLDGLVDHFDVGRHGSADVGIVERFCEVPALPLGGLGVDVGDFLVEARSNDGLTLWGEVIHRFTLGELEAAFMQPQGHAVRVGIGTGEVFPLGGLRMGIPDLDTADVAFVDLDLHIEGQSLAFITL